MEKISFYQTALDALRYLRMMDDYWSREQLVSIMEMYSTVQDDLYVYLHDFGSNSSKSD